MSHKTSLTVTFLMLLTACGSSQNAPERTSELPFENNNVLPVSAAPIVVNQDANETVAPGPVQPNAPIVATPLPTVWPTPAPSETPTPIASATPIPTPTPTATPSCAQVKADGTYDYTCGLWILNPLNNGACQAHAAELELINQNGTWYDGTFVVTIDAQGGLSWNGLTLGNAGGGTYYVHSTEAGRTNQLIPCYFNALPAN